MEDEVELVFEEEEVGPDEDTIFERARESFKHLSRWTIRENDYLIFKRWCPEQTLNPYYGFVVGVWKDPKNLLHEVDSDLNTPFDCVIVRGDGYVYDELIRRLY